MAQHLLIADLAAPLLLAGVRNPVLVFFLPRARARAARAPAGCGAAFRRLRQPLVAMPVYVAHPLRLALLGLLRGRRAPPARPRAAAHELHRRPAARLVVGARAQAPPLRGELWKIGYIFAARMSTMFLGMSFVFVRAPIYTRRLRRRRARDGLTALADQQTAGGMMITLDIVHHGRRARASSSGAPRRRRADERAREARRGAPLT